MFPSKQPPPELGDVNYGNVSGGQRGRVLPWARGMFRAPAKWISPAYNRYTRDPGRTRGEHWFCNIMAAFAQGPIDRLYGIYGDGYFLNVGWTGNDGGFIARDVTNPYHIDVRGWGDNVYDPHGGMRIHWGVPGAPRNFLFEQHGLGPAGSAVPDAHPNYQGVFFLEARSCWMGINNPKRLINIEVLAAKFPDLPDELSGLDDTFYDIGINPVTAVADWMTDPLGWGRPVSEMDIPWWEDLSAALQGAEYAINPYLPDRRAADVWANEMLSYFDGHVIKRGGKWQIGWIPPEGEKPEVGVDVPIFTHHDCCRPPVINVQAAEDLISKLIVDATEAYPYMRSTPRQFTSSLRRRGQAVGEETQVGRLWSLTPWAVNRWAIPALRAMGEERHEGTVYLRKEKARRIDGKRLMRGDMFYLTDEPGDVTLLFRIENRREIYQSGEVQLEVMSERGSFPQPFVDDPDPDPDLSLPAVAAIQFARIFELPWRLAPGPRPSFTVLVERPDPTITGASIYYSEDDIDYGAEPLATHPTWSVRGYLQSAPNATALTITVSIANLDNYILESGTDVDAANDQLLLIVGNEIMSIIEIRVLSGSLREIDVIRGRLGSLAASYSFNAEAYITRRENITIISHETLAPGKTIYAKVQPRNLFQDMALGDEDITNLSSDLLPADHYDPTIELTPLVSEGVIQWDPVVVVSRDRQLGLTVTPRAEPLRSVHVVLMYADSDDPEVIPTIEDGSHQVLYEKYFATGEGTTPLDTEVRIPAPRVGWTNITVFVTDTRGGQNVAYATGWYFIHGYPAPSGLTLTPLTINGETRPWHLRAQWNNPYPDSLAELEVLEVQTAFFGDLDGAIDTTQTEVDIMYAEAAYAAVKSAYEAAGSDSVFVLTVGPSAQEKMLVESAAFNDGDFVVSWTVLREWSGTAYSGASAELPVICMEFGPNDKDWAVIHGQSSQAYFEVPEYEDYVVRVWSLDNNSRRSRAAQPVYYYPPFSGPPSGVSLSRSGSTILISWTNPSNSPAWDYLQVTAVNQTTFVSYSKRVTDRTTSTSIPVASDALYEVTITSVNKLGPGGFAGDTINIPPSESS